MTSSFPLMPSKSTELRLMHFDDSAYVADTTTVLYRLVDSLCGTVGAGNLLNQIFLTRLSGALETIYFNDLDYLFGKVEFLSRGPSESYTYSPQTDLLTSDQWDEVRIKDAWYRARIADFFKACSLGSTPDGIRMCVTAALACDADIYEVWRYVDNFGIQGSLGRISGTISYIATDLIYGSQIVFNTQEGALAYVESLSTPWAVSAVQPRNEIVVVPHKTAIEPGELRLLRDMLAKIVSIDTVITVNNTGLSVLVPLHLTAAASNSSYYEVQRQVMATPVMSQLPPPELLAFDLLPTETWLYQATATPQIAPTAAFNITAEYGYYYLVGGGKRSPIDSVTYGTLNDDGTVTPAPNYQVFNTTGQYAPKKAYETADSPDNYPGGKYGIHPSSAPALNPDGTPYIFPLASQAEYVAQKALEVLALGGTADAEGYCLPIQGMSSSAMVFYPDYAIAYFPPGKDSDVSASITRQRNNTPQTQLNNPSNFVRS